MQHENQFTERSPDSPRMAMLTGSSKILNQRTGLWTDAVCKLWQLFKYFSKALICLQIVGRTLKLWQSTALILASFKRQKEVCTPTQDFIFYHQINGRDRIYECRLALEKKCTVYIITDFTLRIQRPVFRAVIFSTLCVSCVCSICHAVVCFDEKSPVMARVHQ